MGKQVSIVLERNAEKALKNTVQFVEKTESEFTPEVLGTIYVQKSALAELHYTGEKLGVTIVSGKVNGGIVFRYERATTNKVLFLEVVENDWTPEKIGKVYVPKSTLADIGYKGGEITVKIALAK